MKKHDMCYMSTKLWVYQGPAFTSTRQPPNLRQVQLCFMAEIDEAKSEYLMSRFPGTSVFQDVSDMGKAFAPTWNDGKAAKVPKA